MSVVKQFEIWVDKEPDGVAIEDHSSSSITYMELNQSINRLARYLLTLGVNPGDIVGVALERSFELLTSLLSILKMRATCLPLDISYPQSRLQYMLSDSKPALVISSEKLIRNLPIGDERTVLIENISHEFSATNNKNLSDVVRVNDPAYVLYTSGSTGTPKGVVMPHRSLENLISWQLQQSHMGVGSRTLQFTPLSFDVSFQEIFSTLCSGGTLVLIPDEIRRDPEELIDFMQEKEIDRFFMPFVSLQAVCEFAVRSGSEIASLKEIVTAGEQLKITPVLRSFFDKHSHVRFFNHYGPTETHVATSYTLRKGPNKWPALPPIGKPIANTSVYILDEGFQKVPSGKKGEICIAGDCLASGYLNQPELTAAKFVSNPFNPGQKMYLTGDIGYYSGNNNIEFVGRKDNQVKIRGFRVEPGEVEATLAQHPRIIDAVVIPYETDLSDKRLAAYVVIDQEYAESKSEIRKFLESKLPEYMVPTSITIMTEFPLTPSGKVDRQSLPPPDKSRPDVNENYVPPRNSIEETLAQIWMQVIGLEKIGIHDNYFEIGGDSILSIQITSLANQAGIRLKTNQVLQHQSIAELAKVVETTSLERRRMEVVTGPLPVFPLYWRLFEKKQSPSNHLIQTVQLLLKDDIRIPVLEQAFHQLLMTHDALLQRFEPEKLDGKLQVDSKDLTFSFDQINLSKIADEDQMPEIQSALLDFAAGINLTYGPLIKAAIFQMGKDKPILFYILIHQLAVDGLSWRFLFEDLDLIYKRLNMDESPELPGKSNSYLYWVKRMSDYQISGSHQPDVDYWQNLPTKMITSLPLDYPDVGENHIDKTHANIQVVLDSESTQALLTEVSKTYKTLVTDVLVTALIQSISKWTGSPFLFVDLEGSSREGIFDEIDLSHTIGNFSYVYPVLLSSNEETNPGELLLTIKEQLRQAQKSGLYFDLIRYSEEEGETAEKIRQLPAAQVSFLYMGQIDNILNHSSLFEIKPSFLNLKRNLFSNDQYLLDISSGIIQGKLNISFSFDRNKLKQDTIEALALDFMAHLERLINYCKTQKGSRYTPSDFPEANLNQKELDDLLAEISEYEE